MIVRILLLFIIFFTLSLQAEKKDIKRNPFEKFSTKSSVRISSKDMFKNIKKGGLILKLKGVIWDISDPEAVLEIQQISKTVKIGETVGPVFVSDITQKELILKVDNKTYILGLGKEIRI